MASIAELFEQSFGRWSTIGFYGFNARGRSLWLCECKCGNWRVVREDLLTRGLSNSCGCLAKEISSKRQLKHGKCINNKHNGNSTYVSWKGMKQRCHNKKSEHYHLYGALGVKVCDRWMHSFENFLEDMGERPEGMTLDRINPYGNYEPGNCRWADVITQNNNQRRHHQRMLA